MIALHQEVPLFVPHPCVRNGHLQTIAGRYLRGPRIRLPAVYHEIEVEGGDRLTLLDSIPAEWTPGRPQVLMVHGLGGCARSPYVVRVAARLVRMGIRVVRMNLRGAGSGFGLARGTYHAGRTADLRSVAEWMNRRGEGSPLALIGFSLGANLVLKLASEASDTPLNGLDCVLAANPPIDLARCCRQIQRSENSIYDRNFVRQLRAEIAELHAIFPDLEPITFPKSMTLLDFDDLYTAPRNGFLDAADYYARNSAKDYIPRIEVSGLVVHATDDPFIPVDPFYQIAFPARLALELIPGGGHLGYLSRKPWNGDCRWLDGRLCVWLAARWGQLN